MKKLLSAIPILSLALVAAAQEDREWAKTYNVTGEPVVVLRSNDAHVRVSSSAQPGVSARLVVKGLSRGDYDVKEQQLGDRVEIELRLLPTAGHFDWGNRSLGLEVTMPSRGSLEVHTGDGHVRVEGVGGSVRLHTGDGHLEARNLGGILDLETNDGHINVDQVSGSLRARTGDGHITVRGRFDDLNLETGDGHVTAQIEDGSIVSQSWSLRSGDGGIQLELPRSFAAELDASTGDGAVRVQLAEAGNMKTDRDRSHVFARLGAGGKPLTLRTGDGKITLTQR